MSDCPVAMWTTNLLKGSSHITNVAPSLAGANLWKSKLIGGWKITASGAIPSTNVTRLTIMAHSPSIQET